MQENEVQKRRHWIKKTLTESEFKRLQEQAQKRWEYKGEKGEASIPFMLDILPVDMSLTTFRKMLPKRDNAPLQGIGVSERILQKAKREIIPPSAANDERIYCLHDIGLRKQEFIDVIVSLPYNLASSQVLRDMLPRAPASMKPRLFQWCVDIILERREAEPELVGMLANQLFHGAKHWTTDEKQLEDLQDLCNVCLSKQDARRVIVVEPLALFLDAQNKVKIHQAHLREVINAHEWREVDANRVHEYYQTRATQVAAIRHHWESRSNNLQSISDIGRLIHLISVVCATSQVQDNVLDDSRSGERRFVSHEKAITDYAGLASQMLTSLKAQGQSALADDALRVLLKALKPSPVGKSVSFRLFGRSC